MIKILSLTKLVFISGRFSKNAFSLTRHSAGGEKYLFLLDNLILDFTHDAVGEKIVRTTIRMSSERSN